MRPWLPLPKGSPITCGHCGAIVVRTAVDLHMGMAYMGKWFVYPDGRTVKDGEAMECRVCGKTFQGFNEHGVTG